MPTKKRVMDDYETFYAPNRAAWREWLAQNYATSPGVWFIFYKKATGKPTLTYDEAVEEALCYGWIDSLPRKLDEERHMLYFAPRKPKSVWSKLNKDRVEKLLAQNLIMPPGMEKIEAAKRDGSWDALNNVEAMIMPPDLQEALAANPTAQTNFDAFNNSTKKAIYQQIEAAKRPETRAKRIALVVSEAEQNIKSFQPKS
jgi:uncharacterized protein YdeI (YjbR/CyaY-like superfamily)